MFIEKSCMGRDYKSLGEAHKCAPSRISLRCDASLRGILIVRKFGLTCIDRRGGREDTRIFLLKGHHWFIITKP